MAYLTFWTTIRRQKFYSEDFHAEIMDLLIINHHYLFAL